MSEHQSNRPSLEAGGASARKTDSQFRLIRGDEELVIPDHAEPTDDSPTIISKVQPAPVPETAVTNLPEMPAGKDLRGQRLAHFELLEPIGVGGMAAVLRARDLQLDRFVALKILPPEMAADPENVRRFHHEARAAAKLDHENIARVFFCGEDKRLHFIAFEFVEGENLRTLLERDGPLPVAQAVRYILQIATGLEHASSRGVVHRDIKPSNIIISANGRAKLVDMGLARSVEPHGDQALTQPGVTLGTFDYISPEQALEPREADSRSDIYSLGCTFYHMLTGHAPVPEGTAAKKLHHHQHVAPVDPRQLNRDIPDEVAAILMRMMAKEPKDRYQRPVHLVQHLMQVAQKVGAGADVPEGVMFVDAPLPGAPRLRPMLTISLAMLGLGFLLVLISLTPTKQPVGPRPVPGPLAKGGENNPPKDPTGAKTPGVVPALHPTSVTTREQLVDVLEDKQRGDDPINLERSISLGDGSLVYQGDKRKLVLQSRLTGDPATLRFKYQPVGDLASQGDRAVGLTIEGGSVEFKNLRFEAQSDGTPNLPVAIIAVKGTATVRFVGCTFVQKDIQFLSFLSPGLRDSRMPIASVLVENPGGDPRQRPNVVFEECYWEQGQVAVAIQGPGKVLARNCAFGPHSSLFHLRDDSRELGTELTLSRCSAFVVQGPAFRLDGNHGCDLRVSQSIFSCPVSTGGDNNRDEIQLIRQTDAREPLVRYQGLRNCLHNLDALWVWPSADGFKIKASYEDFRDQVSASGGTDKESTVLTATSSPWAAGDPLAKRLNPKEAFQVRGDLREVRSLDGKTALGVESCVWGTMAALAPLPAAPGVAEIKTKPNERIIDPDAADDTPGVYQSFAKALPFIKPGNVNVLLVKQRSDKTQPRDIDIKTLLLDDPNLDLTIKPYPGHQPLLVLAEKTQQKDAALFRLLDGKLHFESLEFLLEPEQLEIKDQYKAQSIVALAGNGLVSFKNCAITLKQPDRSVPLSVATFLDPSEMLKMMAPARAQAQVHFTDCLVRGEGDLVNVRGSRPFELKIDNSLLALAGSALQLQGTGKDVPVDMPMQVKMSHVSAFLSEPLIVLRSGKAPRSLGLTRCDSISECLFVGLADKPLVLLDGVDATEETLKQHFEWKGLKNAYVNLSRVLEAYPPEQAFPSLTLDGDAWTRLESEPRLLSTAQGVASLPPASLRVMSRLTLEKFEINREFREELAPFGANLDAKTLPRFAPRKLETSNAGYAP